jgi:HD-like signal output (HDOD) protein
MRPEWEMEFVASGQQALVLMEEKAIDVIVTDIRMPAMNGAQLLDCVKERFPRCLRFILSGEANQGTILRAVNPAHQFLAKPCKAAELKRRLEGAFAIRGLIQSEELRALVSRQESLPSFPALYAELTNEASRSEPSVSKIGKLVSADMAMTAKILQLVNSPFFGLRCQISSPSSAVQLLGLDIIKSLVLSAHVFSKFQTKLLDIADIDYLWQRSLGVGSFAKRIATMEGAKQSVQDECFTTGLLHDIGKLILASAAPSRYGEVIAQVRDAGANIVKAESEILGCSHAEVGAFLMALWGLPDIVVEAVAFHHNPKESFQSSFSPVIATHAATIYYERLNPSWIQDGTKMDLEYLQQIGYLKREQEWSLALLGAPSAQELEH